MLEKKFYCYRHIRLDTNEPFYIGIGTKCKDFNSLETEYARAFEKRSRSFWWKKIANKTEYIVEILYESNSREEICNKEKEFIKLYGRRNLKLGPLINLTEGGEGFSGRHTEKTKKQIKDWFTGKTYEDIYGKEYAEDQRKKRSEAAKKAWKDMDENKRKEIHERIGKSNKGKTIITYKIICPFCNKEGGACAMKRWHFENCKVKK